MPGPKPELIELTATQEAILDSLDRTKDAISDSAQYTAVNVRYSRSPLSTGRSSAFQPRNPPSNIETFS